MPIGLDKDGRGVVERVARKLHEESGGTSSATSDWLRAERLVEGWNGSLSGPVTLNQQDAAKQLRMNIAHHAFGAGKGNAFDNWMAGLDDVAYYVCRSRKRVVEYNLIANEGPGTDVHSVAGRVALILRRSGYSIDWDECMAAAKVGVAEWLFNQTTIERVDSPIAAMNKYLKTKAYLRHTGDCNRDWTEAQDSVAYEVRDFLDRKYRNAGLHLELH